MDKMQDMLNKIYGDEKAEVISNAISDCMNSSLFSNSKFVDVLKVELLEKRILWEGIILSWFSLLSEQYKEGNYDGRNQNSVKMAHMLYDEHAQEVHQFYSLTKELETALTYFSRDHKTLQDNFTVALVALIWQVDFNNKIFQRMKSTLTEKRG